MEVLKEDLERSFKVTEGVIDLNRPSSLPDSKDLLSAPVGKDENFLDGLGAGPDIVVGLITVGKIYRGVAIGGASKLSWFESDRSDIDYSIYDGELCVKEFFSTGDVNRSNLSESVNKNKNNLDLLKNEKIELAPGVYDAYFSPSAVNEMLGMFNWYGLQGKAFAEKQSVFMDLFAGTKSFSSKFSLERTSI